MKKTMRFLLPLLLTLLFVNQVKAQIAIGTGRDSLKKYQKLYTKLKDDKYLFWIYISKGYIYRRNNTDSEYYYGSRALKLAKKTKNSFEETLALDVLQYCQRAEGNFAEALNLQFRMLELSKELKLAGLEGQALNSIGNTYLDMDAPQTGLNYYRKSLAVFDRIKVSYMQMNECSNIGNAFEKLNMLDSALFYEQNLLKNKQFPADLLPELIYRIGNANVKLRKYREAISYYKNGLAEAAKIKTINDVATIYYQLARLNFNMQMPDSANYYALRALNVAKSISLSDIILKSSQLLVNIFDRQGKIDSAYHYQKIATRYNDILFGAEKFNKIQQILSAQQQREQKLLKEQGELKNRYQFIAAIAIILFILVITVLIWRNNLSQRKKNRVLDEQKTLLTQQRDELQTTLVDLNKTQTQLIQSEKMASLGELTAGIAHEIQNPLNFVNNFSEVSKELLGELKEELDKGDIEEAKIISTDVILNLEKINHHGKRADAIVKGMLEHSRASTGQKEPTDINALADEYLRLAYHGLRAKDKSFNAELVTNFDKNVPKVNVIPQDIGRVLLNLFNNAFYAVNQKRKLEESDYKPEVSVSTSFENDQLMIIVKDNGNGIPDAIKEKIMQPFFTTKPTGEGTGLGLSLSYDIVVKGHGGTITVESIEGKGSEFYVKLPVSQPY
ncbi:MAG: tetratricopeptide repeat-containing sensor histidine kinase [Mucilaginibacter sp.]